MTSDPIQVTSWRTGTLRAWLWLLLCWPLLGLAENRIEVTETFYSLTFDEDSRTYQRIAIDTARPGDLVELRISATNIGDSVAHDVELINTVPTGRSELVPGSFEVEDGSGEFRLSRNGDTFFPPSVEMPPEQVRYVQWLIYELEAGTSAELSYRLRIPR